MHIFRQLNLYSLDSRNLHILLLFPIYTRLVLIFFFLFLFISILFLSVPSPCPSQLALSLSLLDPTPFCLFLSANYHTLIPSRQFHGPPLPLSVTSFSPFLLFLPFLFIIPFSSLFIFPFHLFILPQTSLYTFSISLTQVVGRSSIAFLELCANASLADRYRA
eukprot:GHVT01069330.1.p1 GENE.GHVT01069330.1~~GHVT01069330.1.p1  ORF type:complete len:163 (-),score=14.12 GHVT01069330.1:704-1192(-)